MTSASSSLGAWYAFGPAASAPVEVARKQTLRLLDESHAARAGLSRVLRASGGRRIFMARGWL